MPMQAIRVHQFGGPEVLKLEELPDPVPGPGQVVVAVRAVGVNPVETYIRKGIYGPKAFPYTPGMDAAGVIESVGEGVKRFRAGDRVYTIATVTGSYASKTLCTESSVHPLPDHVSFAQGAAVGVPYGTAHRALFYRADCKAGESVLVHGASGGVGIAAVQLARNFGLTVIGTAGSEKGRQLIVREGAHHALDHHDSDHLSKAIALTGGAGVNIILEMLSNVNLGKDLPALSKRGRVIVVGNRGTVEINPRDAMAREADIRGMTLMLATEDDLRGMHAAIVAGLESRTLRPVVGKEMPLSEAASAHELILKQETHGKIVLIP